MHFQHPTRTIFYRIEKTIKDYRRLSQVSISEQLEGITVDQALALIEIHRNPTLNQKEVADMLFKDYASLTRMIELMVRKEYIKRKLNPKDRRRSQLQITPKGEQAIKDLMPIILHNRKTALKGLTENDIAQLDALLKKIINNCNA